MSATVMPRDCGESYGWMVRSLMNMIMSLSPTPSLSATELITSANLSVYRKHALCDQSIVIDTETQRNSGIFQTAFQSKADNPGMRASSYVWSPPWRWWSHHLIHRSSKPSLFSRHTNRFNDADGNVSASGAICWLQVKINKPAL